MADISLNNEKPSKEAFLGLPSKKVIDWIKNHRKTPQIKTGKIVFYAAFNEAMQNNNNN